MTILGRIRKIALLLLSIEGKDIASFQPNFSPAGSDDFVFIKASEGTGYRNPFAVAQAKRARLDGRVIGWYHYGLHGAVQPQVDYFVNSPGIEDGDLLFFDWEGKAIPSVAEKGPVHQGHEGGEAALSGWPLLQYVDLEPRQHDEVRR